MVNSNTTPMNEPAADEALSRQTEDHDNQQPTRIETFLRLNRTWRLFLIPMFYTVLCLMYGYMLIAADVGSGLHVRQTLDKEIATATSKVFNSPNSNFIDLEPRSLADVVIANAEVLWKRRKDRKDYLKRRSELAIKKEKEQKPSFQIEWLDIDRKINMTNGTEMGNGNGNESMIVGLTNITKMQSGQGLDEGDFGYIQRTSGLHINRTRPVRRRTVRNNKSSSGNEGILPLLIMITTCMVFRLCLSASISRFANDHNPSDDDRENESVIGGRLLSFVNTLSGGRDAARLRRRARDARRQRQFQRFVDRLNEQRELNGERRISADSLRLVVSSRDFNGNDYDRLWRFNEENGPAFGSLFSSIGATQAEINRCPTRRVEPNDDLLHPRRSLSSNPSGHDHGQSCPVCLEPYQVGDVIRTIPCFHSFHIACIDPWLAERAECPVCKHSAIG